MKHIKINFLILSLTALCFFNCIESQDPDELLQEIICLDDNIQDPESILINNHELAELASEEENDIYYNEITTKEELDDVRQIHAKKPVTIVVFMAADNDLHPFAWKNIKQMEAVGSNENINIIVQLNTPGYLNVTKRYIIKKGKRLLIAAEGTAPTQKLNSGSPQTLINCVDWAMKHYPADNLILNFWNHGSGCWDPGTSKSINTCELFHVNPDTNMLDLDRNIAYIDHIEQLNTSDQKQRGICFDETYRSYMSNQDVKYALNEIHHRILGGKKIAAVWFDACLMSMIEIANICKDHADYLLGSQDVEYASGSNYQLALSPFNNKVISSREFACHIVESFDRAYQHITPDYTQSAIDLSQMSSLEKNVDLVAEQLLLALKHQANKSVVKVLKECKSRPLCTCFEEPSFIDLRHFYINVQANLYKIKLLDGYKEIAVKDNLTKLLEQGINLINIAVIANATGSHLPKASGLSIYFPERGMFNSYLKCSFAQSNSWSKMLVQYLIQSK